VALFLRERFPYWKFKWDEGSLSDEHGYWIGFVDVDYMLFNIGGERTPAADPAFFEKLTTHVMEMKRAVTAYLPNKQIK
jgi:hypothetical protein